MDVFRNTKNLFDAARAFFLKANTGASLICLRDGECDVRQTDKRECQRSADSGSIYGRGYGVSAATASNKAKQIPLFDPPKKRMRKTTNVLRTDSTMKKSLKIILAQ